MGTPSTQRSTTEKKRAIVKKQAINFASVKKGTIKKIDGSEIVRQMVSARKQEKVVRIQEDQEKEVKVFGRGISASS